MPTTLLEMYRRLTIWGKAREAPPMDPGEWRFDALGNLIRWSEYGNRQSAHGWELDHFPTPRALGGSDDIDNMRPLHYRPNSQLGGGLGAALESLLDTKASGLGSNAPAGLGGLFAPPLKPEPRGLFALGGLAGPRPKNSL